MQRLLFIHFFILTAIAAYSQSNQMVLMAANATAGIHLHEKVLLKDFQTDKNIEEIVIAIPGKFGGGDGGGSSIAESMSQPLPIELIYFRGASNEKNIRLFWETAQEFNNDIFIIEKKTTENNFVEIGKVNSLGNSNQNKSYSFLDNTPDAGSNYYRLKQIDLDGKYEYSNIVNVQFIGKHTIINIQPNPFSEYIFIDSQKDLDGSLIKIFDVTGFLVFEANLNHGSLNLGKLTAGIYYLKTNGETHKIIKK